MPPVEPVTTARRPLRFKSTGMPPLFCPWPVYRTISFQRLRQSPGPFPRSATSLEQFEADIVRERHGVFARQRHGSAASGYFTYSRILQRAYFLVIRFFNTIPIL